MAVFASSSCCISPASRRSSRGSRFDRARGPAFRARLIDAFASRQEDERAEQPCRVTRVGLKTVTAIGIPLFTERVTSRFFERLGAAGFAQGALAVTPRLLGLLLGLIFVYDRYGWKNFDLQLIFEAGGPGPVPWTVRRTGQPAQLGLGSLNEFFGALAADERRVDRRHHPGRRPDPRHAPSPFAFWRPPQARRVVLCNIATAIVATYLTVYALVLLFWLLFLLGSIFFCRSSRSSNTIGRASRRPISFIACCSPRC